MGLGPRPGKRPKLLAIFLFSVLTPKRKKKKKNINLMLRELCPPFQYAAILGCRSSTEPCSPLVHKFVPG